MKSLLQVSGLLVLFLILQACQPQKGLTIEGTITDASNLQVFVDEVRLGKASNPLQKAEMGTDGQFSLNFEEGLPAGIYNLRIGAKRINFVLDGSETNVTISGNLENLQTYDVTVSGSGDSQTLVHTMQGLFRREYKPKDISTIVDTVSNPHLGAFIAYTALGRNSQFTNIQQKALEKLTAVAPDAESTQAYATYVNVLIQEAAKQSRGGGGPIQVGMAAPNIRMANPQGKEYALSDLKGKVVLLDFWASWCGPCRRENPNVVSIYNRYKDQGFTVYSVSLDGLDARGKARYQTQEDITRAMEGQKQRWVNAIQQDGLAWDYHVSDLKKWESDAGRLYGVSSIPRTFLIDREGKVAAVNLRGAAAIEQALQQVL